MRHTVSASTHTVELQQLAELVERLTALPVSRRPTAEELEVSEVPAARRLAWLSWVGPPEFPFVRGHFGAPSGDGSAADAVVELHTDSLVRLSRGLGLRHRWGVGTKPSGAGEKS